MSRTPMLWSAAVAVLMSACASPAPEPEPESAVDLAAEEQAIRAISARWLELDGAKDAAGIAALFADDGVMYREDEEPIVGVAAIQTHEAGNFTARPQTVTGWTTDNVAVAASGDLAVEHGTWTSSDPGGASDVGRYSTVYRKVNGEWKVVSDMSVSTKPADTTAATPAN